MSRPMHECVRCCVKPELRDLPMGQCYYHCPKCGIRGPVGSFPDDAAVMWNQAMTLYASKE